MLSMGSILGSQGVIVLTSNACLFLTQISSQDVNDIVELLIHEVRKPSKITFLDRGTLCSVNNCYEQASYHHIPTDIVCYFTGSLGCFDANTMESTISLIIAFACIPLTLGVTGVFLKMNENENCTLIVRCSFYQVEARSKGECVLLTTLLDGSGSYYNSSTKLCYVCKHNSTFSSLDSDLGYYAIGRLLTDIDMGLLPDI